MSYNFYHILHLFGLFLMMVPLGAIASHGLQGGKKAELKNRKLFMKLHGTGLLIVFIAGFGLIAKGGHSFTSGWVYVKMLCWLVVGMYPLLFYKQKQGSLIPLLGLFATLFVAILFVEYKFF